MGMCAVRIILNRGAQEYESLVFGNEAYEMQILGLSKFDKH